MITGETAQGLRTKNSAQVVLAVNNFKLSLLVLNSVPDDLRPVIAMLIMQQWFTHSNIHLNIFCVGQNRECT